VEALESRIAALTEVIACLETELKVAHCKEFREHLTKVREFARTARTQLLEGAGLSLPH
jgi:hypothetical protein